jgi:hypothetical protein
MRLVILPQVSHDRTRGPLCQHLAFVARAIDWFADHDITVERVMTDNGSCYRSLASDSEPCAVKPIQGGLRRRTGDEFVE